MTHTPPPSAWAGFHRRPPTNNDLPPQHMMSMFSDHPTTRPDAYIEQIPEEAGGGTKTGSLEGLMGAFSQAGITRYDSEVVVGIPDDSPPLPPTAISEWPSRLRTVSRVSLHSVNALTEYPDPGEGVDGWNTDGHRFKLMDTDTVVKEGSCDESRSSRPAESESRSMSICSIATNYGDGRD